MITFPLIDTGFNVVMAFTVAILPLSIVPLLFWKSLFRREVAR